MERRWNRPSLAALLRIPIRDRPGDVFRRRACVGSVPEPGRAVLQQRSNDTWPTANAQQAPHALRALRELFPQTAIACALLATPALAQPVGSFFHWSTLAGDASRTSTRATALSTISTPRWTLSQTTLGQPIRFIGPASIVASTLPTPRIYTTGIISNQTHAIAVNADTGQVAWTTPIPALILDSYSAPALGHHLGIVLYSSGTTITALRLIDGSLAWQTPLTGAPVNATPIITTDLGSRNRAFTTDYGGFGGSSLLYCINVSPFHQTINPYQPGEIVWSAPIGSATGASPTYLGGVVYVTSTGLDATNFGEIRAFDARTTITPAPLWTFTNTIAEGFFGGLTIRESASGVHIFAATYAFFGQTSSANMVKLNARTGALVWSVACNRTESIPIPLDDGRIILSSGVQGFGSVPMVQMFQDFGSSATQLWNTATSTWTDANQNGVMDVGEFLLIGGRVMQPVLLRSTINTPRLLIGANASAGNPPGPGTILYELDLTKAPHEPGFIVQQSTSMGSSPGLLGAGVYAHGTSGLAALGALPPHPDLNNDARFDLDDLILWEQGLGPRDVDRDGSITPADRTLLLRELRLNEHRSLTKGRN